MFGLHRIVRLDQPSGSLTFHGGSGPTAAFVSILTAFTLLLTTATTWGQIVTPQISGPAQGAYEHLYPPSALAQVRERAMQQSPPLPPAQQPSERWVPERRVHVPEMGRELLVPGHYERRLSDQHYAVPSLPAYDPSTGATVTLPGSERPPAELRQSP
jgi:hypothetical protein